ncbi:MAG TPA: hypothetical protein DCQ13_04915 [Firmicutes bacterium]|nr:hypothetical protein [Bacillota bacterium]
MRKRLAIATIIVLALFMALPTSAATLKLSGEYTADFTYSYNASGDPVWSPSGIGPASKLSLDLTFVDGNNISAFLPLTIKPFMPTPSITAGNWYFSYDGSPWSFWAARSSSTNAKRFRSMNDPLLVLANRGGNWALNANATLYGADIDLYTFQYNKRTAWLGRITYPTQSGLTLGLLGYYREEKNNVNMNFGADVVGPVPGLGGNLTLAAVGRWKKTGPWNFEGQGDNLAYTFGIEGLPLGPVELDAKYSAVGDDFKAELRSTRSDASLQKYKDSAALEAEARISLPMDMPATLTLGNNFWMFYPDTPKWHETTGSFEISPLSNLSVTLSGAYKADLIGPERKDPRGNTVTENFDGYMARVDAEYEALGLTFTPFVSYEVDSYADKTVHNINGEPVRADTTIGLAVAGSPIDDLTLAAEASYKAEEPQTHLKGWGIYATDSNLGLVLAAESKVAAVAELNSSGSDDAETDIYAYFGTDAIISPKLIVKTGILSKDNEGKFVASVGLTHRASNRITSNLTWTYREANVLPDETDPNKDMWRPFEDEGKNYLEAAITSTVGSGTLKLAYGVSGLQDCKCSSSAFHSDKPWAWIHHHPDTYMNWQLMSLSVKVPF